MVCPYTEREEEEKSLRFVNSGVVRAFPTSERWIRNFLVQRRGKKRGLVVTILFKKVRLSNIRNYCSILDLYQVEGEGGT